jgi:MFS family permease
MTRPIPRRLGLASLVDGRFVTASLVDAVGTGCFLAGSALFFTREVGLSAAQVGVGLTLSGGLGLLTTVPWGRAADRWGARRVLLLLLSARAVAFLLYAFVTSFAAFLAITAFLGMVEKATVPVQDSLLGDVVAEDRRQRALAMVRSTRNLGFALGALAATTAASGVSVLGYDSIVMLNALSFVFAAILIGTMSVARRPRPAPQPHATASRRLHDRRFGALTAVNGALTLHMTLLSVGLPLWLLEHTRTPDAAVPALLIVNTVLAVALQVPVAGLVRSSRGAVAALATAGAALAMCCLAMPLAATLDPTGATVVAVGAVLALTLAEMAQAAGGWDLSFRLAPEAQRGRYLSVFSLGTTAQMLVAPLLLTSVVFGVGTWGWVGLAAFLVGAGLLALVIIQPDERRGRHGRRLVAIRRRATQPAQPTELPDELDLHGLTGADPVAILGHERERVDAEHRREDVRVL